LRLPNQAAAGAARVERKRSVTMAATYAASARTSTAWKPYVIPSTVASTDPITDAKPLIVANVNAQIRGNRPVTTRLMTPDDAVAAGALALFGEKYGDEVRVLSMGNTEGTNYSVELCGGTHVNALGDIALFTFISEGAVASGIRRVEALTGEAARQHLAGREAQLKDVASMLKTAPDEVAGRVETLLAERKRLEKELAEARVEIEKAKTEIKEYKVFVDGLDKEGLINKKGNYSLEHKNGELLINGKKAAAQVTEKYRSFLDKHPKFKLEKTDDEVDMDVDYRILVALR